MNTHPRPCSFHEPAVSGDSDIQPLAGAHNTWARWADASGDRTGPGRRSCRQSAGPQGVPGPLELTGRTRFNLVRAWRPGGSRSGVLPQQDPELPEDLQARSSLA